MIEVLRRVWLPTLLFTVPIFLFELLAPGQKDHPLSSWTFYALIAVPVVWSLTTSRHGLVSVERGAFGGALCGAAIVLIPVLIEVIKAAARPRDNSGGLPAIAAVIFMTIALSILVPVGASIGMITAMLQKPRSVERR